MDWVNERYVRWYTRDTEDWLSWSWEARALFGFLLRKADRSGVLDARRGPQTLARLVNMPVEVVERALPELMTGDGAPIRTHPNGYVFRNYIEAQETRQSDRARARDARERRRARAAAANEITELSEYTDESVTASPALTASHQRSPRVTTRYSVPSLADPSLGTLTPERRPSAAPRAYTRAIPQSARVRSSKRVKANGGINGHALQQAITPAQVGLAGIVDAGKGAEPEVAKKRKLDVLKPRRSRANKRSHIPPEWSPNENHRAIAAERHVDLELEAAKFRDWALAKGELKADWDAAFRIWLRRAQSLVDVLQPQFGRAQPLPPGAYPIGDGDL